MKTVLGKGSLVKLFALFLTIGSMNDCLAKKDAKEKAIDLDYSACIGPAKAAQTQCHNAANQWANFCLRYSRYERPVEHEGSLGDCFYGLRQRKTACGQQFSVTENQCNLARCHTEATSLAAVTRCSQVSACVLNRINSMPVCEAQNSDVFVTTYNDYRFYHLFATLKQTYGEAEDALENAAYSCKVKALEEERRCLNP